MKFKCTTCGTNIDMKEADIEKNVKKICNMVCCFRSFTDHIKRKLLKAGLHRRKSLKIQTY